MKMGKEEDGRLMSNWMEKQQDLESCGCEKREQVVKEQLQSVEEESGCLISLCSMFGICVAVGFMLLFGVSGAYQFFRALRRPSYLHPSQVHVELLPVYVVPYRANDQVLDGFLEEPRFNDRVSHVDEYQGEAILHDGRAYLTSQHSSDKKGVVARTHSVGRVLHSQVVRMKHRGPKPGQESVASFQVTFVFSIENNLAGREATGDGFAFVMVPEGNVLGCAGGSLGVMDLEKDSQHTFAVEFDTWKNSRLHDISNNHVGVNVNSMVSMVAEEAGYWVSDDNERLPNEFRPLDLTSGKIQAWIDYDCMSQELTVRISPLLGKKPYKPLLRTNLDLSKVLNQYMSVGFSAGTGDFAAKHIIHGWQFEETSTPHWPSANNMNQKQLLVLPTASHFFRNPQLFRARALTRGVSHIRVFRNPHQHRYKDMSGGVAASTTSTEATLTYMSSGTVTTVLPALEELVERNHCAELLPDFPKMDFATFKENLALYWLLILLCVATAVLLTHTLIFVYHIVMGCYETCLDYTHEAFGIVHQTVLLESDVESTDARFVLVVSDSQQCQQ